MSKIELIMPKMGESITDATILKWLKNVGDSVAMDEAVLEIATDKVDSEVPSTHEGVIAEVLYEEGVVVDVGKVLAIIETNISAPVVASSPVVNQSAIAAATSAAASVVPPQAPAATPVNVPAPAEVPYAPQPVAPAARVSTPIAKPVNGAGRFYSPLVLNIASKEGISMVELEQIPGSGQNSRVTKKDLLNYIKNRASGVVQQVAPVAPAAPAPVASPAQAVPAQPTPTQSAPIGAGSINGEVEIIEMDRMRKMIAKNMIASKQTSAHVTSFVEADVTRLVNWRNKWKKKFLEREGEKLTFTPIFIEALVKAIKDFPMINISIDGDRIIRKKNINMGMAAALPSGNLIVPVIHNADQYNLVGLAKRVNDLAGRARTNKLKPDEIQGGTYTISNVGTFGNVMGTPIIPQPQVAIMAVGSIKKKPVVVETEEGDNIAIRHMMFLSHSYDHRVVDGALGGMFVRKVADYLEQFDPYREI